ncbi:unnamed protein product [Schistocephalus solidus]|uniref:Uncharacterized protein n=1 Tax=Schistocephalus solidus TaxID=70667 RepID=A0A183TGG5_SCHSO|nr:unnamed protein product [Schistocephalus solidus]
MELIDPPLLLLEKRPYLRGMEQRRQDDSFVHLELGAEMETVLILDDVLRKSEGLAGFGDPVGGLIVDFGAAGEVAAQVRECVYGFQLGPNDLESR